MTTVVMLATLCPVLAASLEALGVHLLRNGGRRAASFFEASDRSGVQDVDGGVDESQGTGGTGLA